MPTTAPSRPSTAATPQAAPVPDWSGVRLHVVSGKGGTGKTTVAAALALALAAGGRRTLLCEVEGRQGIAQLFDVPQLPYAEQRVAVGPDGGEMWALAIEPKAALMEYLDLFYHLGRAGKVLEKIGAIDFATTIAPGLRDVLLTGKVYEATRRRDAGAPRYDAVVLDAPPTGRIGNFLNVTEEVADLAKVGPIRNQSGSVMSLLRSAQTAVHLVTVLEEMPVQETQDAVAELTRIGLPVGAVVVNMVREELLPARALGSAAKGRFTKADIASVTKSLDAVRLGRHADALLAEGVEHAQRVMLEREQRSELEALDRPLVELAFLSDGIDLGALYQIAETLAAQGIGRTPGRGAAPSGGAR